MFSKKVKIFAVFCSFLLLSALFFAYINCVVKPILYIHSEAYVKTLITSVVCEALGSDELNEFYEDSFRFTYKADGSLSTYSSNMISANKIRSFISKKIIADIKSNNSMIFRIHVGSLSGLPLLYGCGPEISVNLTALCGITCNIASEFTDSGLNQTLHRLTMNVDAETSIKEPLSNKKICVGTSVPISETVIIGDVPDAYTVIIRADENDEDDINDYGASVD